MKSFISLLKSFVLGCISDRSETNPAEAILGTYSYGPIPPTPRPQQMSELLQQIPPPGVPGMYFDPLPRTRKSRQPYYPQTISPRTPSYVQRNSQPTRAGTFPFRGEYALPAGVLEPLPAGVRRQLERRLPLPKVRPSRRRRSMWYLFPQQVPGYKPVV